MSLPVSSHVSESLERASWIRKMFEEGLRLKKELGEENVYDFSLGNPDLDPPVEFYRTLEGLLSRRDPGIHGYMPNAGFPDVRESIAGMISRVHDISISGEHVLMTCGAAGGLNVVLKAILDPGDQVIVPRPYFVEYGFYVKNHGGEIVTVDTNPDFSLNIENIRKAATGKTRVVLINSPNNPTGRVYGEEEIRSLSELLKSMEEKGRPVYLISDEPYREIVYDGRTVPGVLKHCSQSIMVYSYSKSISIPGERIGYVAVNPSCRGADRLMAALVFCNRTLGFVNAPALMQRVVGRMTDITVNAGLYGKRRDILMEGLRIAGYEFAEPQGAFYLFCKSPIPDDVKFVQHLLKYNILAVPGSGFGGPGYFRLAYCVSESVITRSLSRFREAMQAL